MGSNAGRSVLAMALLACSVFLVLRGSSVAIVLGLGVILAVGPALAIRTVRVPREVQVAPVELDDAGPAWIGQYVRSVSDELKSEGFVALGSFVSRAGGITLARTILREPSAEVVAVVFCSYRDAAPTLPATRYIAFFSNLVDERQRSTGNNHRPAMMPIPDDVIVERLPQVKDPARLYRVHCALMARDRKREPRSYRLSETFDAAAFVREIEARARRNHSAWATSSRTATSGAPRGEAHC